MASAEEGEKFQPTPLDSGALQAAAPASVETRSLVGVKNLLALMRIE
jgi:hypothetical protein